MGFFNRRSKPTPPPPPPPAPAVQVPSTPSPTVKKGVAAQGGEIKPGGASTTPTIQTTAQGVMTGAPLQYASLLGQVKNKKPGMM